MKFRGLHEHSFYFQFAPLSSLWVWVIVSIVVGIYVFSKVTSWTTLKCRVIHSVRIAFHWITSTSVAFISFLTSSLFFSPQFHSVLKFSCFLILLSSPLALSPWLEGWGWFFHLFSFFSLFSLYCFFLLPWDTFPVCLSDIVKCPVQQTVRLGCARPTAGYNFILVLCVWRRPLSPARLQGGIRENIQVLWPARTWHPFCAPVFLSLVLGPDRPAMLSLLVALGDVSSLHRSTEGDPRSWGRIHVPFTGSLPTGIPKAEYSRLQSENPKMGGSIGLSTEGNWAEEINTALLNTDLSQSSSS